MRSHSSDVAPDALPAGLVEAGDPVALDVRLAGEAQLLLDLELHGEAVGVPAPSGADDVLPPHAPVAQDDVLRRAGFDVVDPRAAVGRGRALEEDEGPLAVAAARGPAGRCRTPSTSARPLLRGPERRPWDRPRQTPSCPSLPAAELYPAADSSGCPQARRRAELKRPHPLLGTRSSLPRGTTPLGPLVTRRQGGDWRSAGRPAHPGAITPVPRITEGQSGLVYWSGALAGPAGLARRAHP